MQGRSTTVRVSKMLSLMLRHRPQEFDVEVDAYGFADLDEVVQSLQTRDERIGASDVDQVVNAPEKQRFEIVDGRIRARYGHSFEIDLGQEPFEPPDALYKGASARHVDQILADGLQPGDRQYVHLSYEIEVAGQLGRDTDTVLRISALEAHQAGVAFYDCGPTVLTREIPAAYLQVEGDVPERGGGRNEAPEGRSRSQDTSPSPVPAAEAPQFGRKRRFGRR
jgi:putative RNA 2'-phosphotransferase